MGEDLDILMYVVLFLMGAIVAIADRAASGVECKANGKIFKFYPIRHISTALAVMFAVAAFIYYGVAGSSSRNNVLGILGVALILITVTFVYDMFLIFWRFNKKRGEKKAEDAAKSDDSPLETIEEEGKELEGEDSNGGEEKEHKNLGSDENEA